MTKRSNRLLPFAVFAMDTIMSYHAYIEYTKYIKYCVISSVRAAYTPAEAKVQQTADGCHCPTALTLAAIAKGWVELSWVGWSCVVIIHILRKRGRTQFNTIQLELSNWTTTKITTVLRKGNLKAKKKTPPVYDRGLQSFRPSPNSFPQQLLQAKLKCNCCLLYTSPSPRD